MTDRAWVVDVLRIGSSPTLVTTLGVAPAQTERASALGANTQLWASAEGPVTPPGAYSDGWTWTSVTANAALSVAVFKPLSGLADAGMPLDAGSSEVGSGPRRDVVGCGCGSSAASLTPLLLLATVRTLRRAARR
jgi:hypothetical protein